MKYLKYVVFASILYAFPASACQLAGKYRTFVLDAGGGFATTQNCVIKVDLIGRVYGGFCNIRDEFGGAFRDNITGGQWYISNCIVSGTTRFAIGGSSKIEAAINGEAIVGRVKDKRTAILFTGVKVP